MMFIWFIFIPFAHYAVSAPNSGGDNVCSSAVSTLHSRQVSYSTSRQTSSQTNCGFLGWSRCTKYSRQYSVAYRTEYYRVYSTNYFCCTGWAEDGQGGCPIAICTTSCGSGGECVSPDVCYCFSGFEGSRCSNINECLENNGGCQQSCIDTLGSFYCQCYTGYVEANNECIATCNPPCIHGRCTSPDYCDCETNYVGSTCDDFDECTATVNGGCAQICNNLFGGYQCECLPGHVLSNLTECIALCEPTCENGGQCVGVNDCDCPNTYTGDRCQYDVNECVVNNGGCDHSCENLPGSFRCHCLDGFSGTSTCTDIDECTFANCHNCTNYQGSFECLCKIGYEAYDLYNCEDVNECEGGVDGCGQLCLNSIGSFRCDCNAGWTLQPDGKRCTANPCVEIGVPFMGNRICTGFTTGELCTFECETSHRLVGTQVRQCLSNGVWSGQTTKCEEIICPEVPSPVNGYIHFPCENKIGDRCRFGCDSGFYLEGDTVTQCLFAGVWNITFPVCKEIQACTPSPCLNNGVCQVSHHGIRSYTCDCSESGYVGNNCEKRFVTTPDWPKIWVGEIYNLTFIVKTEKTLLLSIEMDSKNVQIEPSNLLFTEKINTHYVSIRGISQGFSRISYILRHDESHSFTTPDDDEIFVFQNHSQINSEIFTPGYQLPSGCFLLFDQSVCTYFISTEEWKTVTGQSNGITSLATETFELPLNLIGHAIGRSSQTTTKLLSNCHNEEITLDDIQDFVHFNSLYRNYTRQLEHVLPEWMTFISINIDPRNADTSFSTLSLSGSDVQSIGWCSNAPVTKDGMYSVYLLYKTQLTLGGRRVSLPKPPFKRKYCFIVGICKITSGTVVLVFPEGSRDILSHIDGVDHKRSLEVNVNYLAFSKTNMLKSNINEKSNISILANLQYSYYINNTVSAKIEGSGDLQVSLENVNQLFSHLFIQRWVFKQFGNSKMNLFWKMLGENIELPFISKQQDLLPTLNATVGGYPVSEHSLDRGILMESTTSLGVFDNTPFSWLLKTSNSSVKVFLDYDLTPILYTQSDLNTLTDIIQALENIRSDLDDLVEQLNVIKYRNLYSNTKPALNLLQISLKKYHAAKSQELRTIGDSLHDLRMQSKLALNSLWSVIDRLSGDASLQREFHSVTTRFEKLSNQVLFEVQDIFAHESTLESGFYINSEVCLSPHLCFPSLEVKILNSYKNCPGQIESIIDLNTSNVCLTGEYNSNKKLNRFISIPAESTFSLVLESFNNHWQGNTPVLINILGIEQVTTMRLEMTKMYFSFSGKLWDLFDMQANATSDLRSLESMVLNVNGEISVEGSLTLGRILKDKIISLSQKSVDDSERRISQAVKSVEKATLTFRDVSEEAALKDENVAEAKTKYVSAENEVLAAKTAVEMVRQSLENAHEETKEIEKYLNNVCEVYECNGVCLPGSKIITIKEDVFGLVSYECCAGKTETTVINETTNCCWTCYVPTPVNSFGFNPFKLIIGVYRVATGNWLNGVTDIIESIGNSKRLSYSEGECCKECKKPVEITVMFDSCSTCVKNEVIGQIEKLQIEEVACSVQIPNANCVKNNEECRKLRSQLFDQFRKTTFDLAGPIKEFDNAVVRASVAEAALNKALIELDDAMNQEKEVLERVVIAQNHLNNTQDALDKLSTDFGAALAIREHQINGSLEESLQLNGLTFNIDLVGKDTSVIPIVCDITLSSFPVLIQIIIDFNNLNYTVDNAALFITEELFGDTTRLIRQNERLRKKRDIINGIITQPPIETVVYNIINNTNLNITRNLIGRNSNTLILNQINSSDAGSYNCHASNVVTSVSSLNCEVTVEFAPYILKHPQDIALEHGNIDGVYFTCEAKAVPLAHYRWYFQSNTSFDMEPIFGQNSSSIKIISPKFSNDGWYVCEAWNKHGHRFSEPARLNVLGISMPEFSSDITIMLYRVEYLSSEHTNNKSLGDVISSYDDDLELELLHYREASPIGKPFLTQITFDIKSTNATSLDIVIASREKSVYQVKDKFESIRENVDQLQRLMIPGELFEHRGEIYEVIQFNSGINGPICTNTQYAHKDGYVCVNCRPGSYRGNDKLPAVCEQCPEEFYQPKEGQTECLKCDGYVEVGSRVCIPNHSMTNIPTTDDNEDKNMLIFALTGGGCAVLMLIVLFLIVYLKKKNCNEEDAKSISKNVETNEVYLNPDIEMRETDNDKMHENGVYAEPDVIHDKDKPTNDENVYSEI